MPSLVDFAELDLRGAFDLAIMIEEDAQIRYEKLSQLIGDDPGGVGDVFRMMVVNEGKHRVQLKGRRDEFFRDAPPRIDVSLVVEGVERPDVNDDELPRTAREALQATLAAERRAYEFYWDAIPYVRHDGARALFHDLMQEELEHQDLLLRKIAQLDATGVHTAAVPATRAPAPAVPTAASEPQPYPDRALLKACLPRFDAATQAVAVGVLVHRMTPAEVAATLGVTRRTVATKLARFLAIVRQQTAPALTEAR